MSEVDGEQKSHASTRAAVRVSGSVAARLTGLALAVAVAVAWLALVYGPSMWIARLFANSLPLAMVTVILASSAIAAIGGLLALRAGLVSRDDLGWVKPQRGDLARWTLLAAVVAPFAATVAQAGDGAVASAIRSQSLLFLACALVLGASLQEELIFRSTMLAGTLSVLRRTETARSTSAGIAVLASTLLFAAVHIPLGVAPAVAAGCLGLLAGVARIRSGSVFPSALIHIVFNVASFIALAIQRA